MTSGRRGPHSNTWNNGLYFQARPQTFTRLWVLRLTSKKLALRYIAPVLVVGHRPPLHPPCVHLTSFTNWQVFPGLPCFLCSSASVYYTECKPKNENVGDLGMRLGFSHMAQWAIYFTLNISHLSIVLPIQQVGFSLVIAQVPGIMAVNRPSLRV